MPERPTKMEIIDLSHTIYSANVRHSLFEFQPADPDIPVYANAPRRIGKEKPTFCGGITWLYRKGRVESVPEMMLRHACKKNNVSPKTLRC